MQIFRSAQAPVRPADPATFVGPARMQPLASSEVGTPVHLYHVEFPDGARTNWHRHSGAQWLFIVEGRVRVQTEGQAPRDLEAGDAVVIAPDERHWHGASPGSRGVHLAVNVDAQTTWLEPVSELEYGAATMAD